MPSDPADLLWFPVRHHSPAAALAVRDVIDRYRPTAILIEGPSDWQRVDQLLLGHTLPISVMAWARWPGVGAEPDVVTHAFFPFTEFSPEWQAISHGSAAGSHIRFIDLPWASQFTIEMGGRDEAAAWQREDAVSPQFYTRLSEYVGRRNLSAVWDELAEIDPHLSTEEYLRRASLLGAGIRADDVAPDLLTTAREAHMAEHIRAARAEFSGTIVVLTGAAHTGALQHLIAHPPEPVPLPQRPELARQPVVGYSLLPTSYEELDAHNGYLAGQPSPGFYDAVFAARLAGAPLVDGGVAERMLAEALQRLRTKGKAISAADVIAVRTTMRGLAEIRGHAMPWRDDLVEALVSVLVKDVVRPDAHDGDHPLVAEVLDALRGSRVGRVVRGTDEAALVTDVRERLAGLGVQLTYTEQVLEADLDTEAGRARSHVFHQLAVLQVPAVRLLADVDDLSDDAPASRRTYTSVQRWAVKDGEAVWAAVVLAGRYGATLPQAVAGALAQRAAGSIGVLTGVVADAVRCGLGDLSAQLTERLADSIDFTEDVVELDAPLGLLLRIHRFDHWYGVVGRADFGTLLMMTARRAVEILERLPQQGPTQQVRVWGRLLRRLCDTLTTGPGGAGDDGSWDALRDQCEAAVRQQTERGAALATGGHTPEVAGALAGALWLLSGADVERTDVGPSGVPAPEGMGQWYAGLLATAGHLAVVAPQIFDPLDAAIAAWAPDEFLSALPELRRAATHLFPRERRALLAHLVGEEEARATPVLQVSEAEMAHLLQRESQLWEQVATYTGALRAEVAP